MNNKCQIANHNQKKIITVCLATQCQGNRVCCQMCQVEFHKDHIEQQVDLDSLMEFIKTQAQKQDVVSPNVAQMLERLNYLKKNIEILLNLFTQEMKRQSSFSLQQYCRDVGNQFTINTEQIGNQQWNQFAQDILSQVEIKNCELVEKSTDVKQVKYHILFMEHFLQQITKINDELQNIQLIIDPNSIMQLTEFHILKGHSDVVSGIDICETRNLLVSASSDSTVKLWNLQNFSLIWSYKDTKGVYDVVFSSDGNLIAYGGSSERINLIDISDLNKQNQVTQLKGHNDTIIRLIFSNDSMYLISLSRDQTVRVWEVKTKVELFKLNSLSSSTRGVTISNDNSLIASIDSYIKIWNFKDQKLLIDQRLRETGQDIQFLNDQQMLVSCGRKIINVWSLAELNQGRLSLIREFQLSDRDFLYSISLTHDSRFIVSYDKKQVKVIDQFTGKLIKLFEIKEAYNNNCSMYGNVAITRKTDVLAYSDGYQIAVWKSS